MLERAISTPSSGCSRITGAGAIGVSLVKSAELASSEWRVANRNTPTRYSLFAIRSLRLAGGILAGLRHLHPGIGRHQSDLIGQGHELESHVDRLGRAGSTAAMNAGIEAALAAFPDDLFVDFENLGFVAIELRHQTIGKAEVGLIDIDAVDALDIEDRF